jgi:hypothetical protein
MSGIRVAQHKRFSEDVMCISGIVRKTLGSVYHHYGVILRTLHKECHLNRAFSKSKARFFITVN